MSVRWLLAFILLIIATATVQAAIPTPPLLADSYTTTMFNNTYFSGDSPFTIDIIDASTITNSSVKFYVEEGSGTATFDNDGGGSWTEYFSFPVTVSPTEDAQYKIAISGTTWEIYSTDGTLQTSGTNTNFWSLVQDDGDDIRVFDDAGNQLYFWIESWDSGQNAVIWVKLPAGSSELNIAYGNSQATKSSYEDPRLFLIGDEFDDGEFDSAYWSWLVTPPSYDEGVTTLDMLHVQFSDHQGQFGTTEDYELLYREISEPFVAIIKFTMSGFYGTNYQRAGIGIRDANGQNYFIVYSDQGANWFWIIFDEEGNLGYLQDNAAKDQQYGWIKAVYDGSTLTMYAAAGSAEPTSWTEITSPSITLQTPFKLGLTGNNIAVDFDYIRVCKLADPAEFGTPTTKTFQMTATNPYISINGNKVQYSGTLDSSNPSSGWISFSDAYWQNGTNTISLGADSGSFYAIVRFDNYKVLTSESLLVRYDFEDGAATDVSGHGNDGTISGTATQVAGRYGYGLDVTSASITVSLSNLNQSWTAWLWAKDNTGWHNYVYEFEGTNIVKEYQDLQQGDYFDIVSYDGTELKIAEFFKGVIDEFRVYNYTLTEEQMRQMYEALRVKFYDESTGERIAANATIFNANYNIPLQTDEVTKEVVLFNADLPETGEYYLISSATDYIERYRIVQLDEYGGEEVNVYLANANDAVLNKIEIIDLTNSFLNGIFTLKSGDKTIEEKRINQNELNVWFLPDRLYSVYISNGKETRNLGLISYDADGIIQLYITPLTINYVNYTGPIAYNYSYNSTTGIITLKYDTTSGDTTSVIFKVYDENGTELYNASATTPSGKFTYIGEANRTYIIELYADNSLQPLNFKVVVLPAKNAVQISVNVGPITTLPEWIRAVFFGGLLIFVSIMFKKTHVPVGLILSLTLAVVFTTTGIITLSNEVFVVLGLITALSLFIWWREDKQVEVR